MRCRGAAHHITRRTLTPGMTSQGEHSMYCQPVFLKCPDYLGSDGTLRCGLPAEVEVRYTVSSTDGPLECAKIRCPSGHWFNGPIELLILPVSDAHTVTPELVMHGIVQVVASSPANNPGASPEPDPRDSPEAVSAASSVPSGHRLRGTDGNADTRTSARTSRGRRPAIMFLDCPANLGQDGPTRCRLPAQVSFRYVMQSTDGPIECAIIRCPAGHWFNGPIESLTYDGKHNDPGTAAATFRPACDTFQGSRNRHDSDTGPAPNEVAGGPQPMFRRPNTAPAYYLGRPAELWINALRPRRQRTMQPRPTSGQPRPYPGVA
jgi:hypothetical protein